MSRDLTILQYKVKLKVKLKVMSKVSELPGQSGEVQVIHSYHLARYKIIGMNSIVLEFYIFLWQLDKKQIQEQKKWQRKSEKGQGVNNVLGFHQGIEFI